MTLENKGSDTSSGIVLICHGFPGETTQMDRSNFIWGLSVRAAGATDVFLTTAPSVVSTACWSRPHSHSQSGTLHNCLTASGLISNPESPLYVESFERRRYDYIAAYLLQENPNFLPLVRSSSYTGPFLPTLSPVLSVLAHFT